MKLSISTSSERVLRALFEANNTPLFINEIIRATDLYPNAVQRSILTLEKLGIIKNRIIGNKKFYSINKNHPNIIEIKSIVTKTENEAENDKVTWIKVVNRECSVALNAAIGISQSNLKYIKRFKISPIEYLWYNSITGGVYIALEQVKKTGNELSLEIKKYPLFAQYLADSCTMDGDKLIAQAQAVHNLNLSRLTTDQLFVHLNKLYILFLYFLPYINIPHSIEEAIVKEIKEKVNNDELTNKLLEPIDIKSEEQIDELKLVSGVKKSGWDENNQLKLAHLTDKYCWLPMMALHHKPFDIKYFKKIIDDLITRTSNPDLEIFNLKNQEKKRKAELEKIFNNIKADRNLRNLVYVAQAYITLRTYRINIVKRFHYLHIPLLTEIAKRTGLTFNEITFLTYEEILNLNNKSSNLFNVKKTIRTRHNGFANLTWKNKTSVISGSNNIIHAMEKFKIIPLSSGTRRYINGQPACKGLVKGKVKIINKISELNKLKKGEILVARMTTPDFMTAIKKAAAIVTDEGGITCHAAIVSREFNIPCIVGTQHATQILNDNDMVEVNAHNGTVIVIGTTDIAENNEILYGKSIFKGKVVGKARIVLDASDFSKFKHGEILITSQATPDFLSVLYRAKGLVVDEDSYSSHAVLYGKALKIPSIMGTAIAKNSFKDGEKLELDAFNGTIKKI